MSFTYFFKLYFLTLPVFLAIDFVWLTLIAKNFYAKQIGFLFSPKPNLISAFIFYLLYVAGVLIFAVVPALRENHLSKAVLLGGLFGLFTYATYDLTNLATIKNWPLIVTIIDILWGIILTASLSLISFIIGKKLL